MDGLRTTIIESLRHMNGPSGGLSYHLAALRYRAKLWRPFLDATAEWLKEWNPPEENLIIFGPSAGWTLHADFLARFKSVVAVEPDPSARWLLRKRFSGVTRLEMVPDSDLLPWLTLQPGRFKDFLETRETHAILFSNLLGQVPLLLPFEWPPDAAQAHRREFLRGLEGRTWASYHDLLSAKGPLISSGKSSEKRSDAFEMQGHPELEDLARRVFHPTCEVLEHDTLWLSEGRRTQCATWQIRPGVHHLIGFIRS